MLSNSECRGSASLELRDLDEAKGWKGSKKFGQIRRRFRRKFEKLDRRQPPSFDIVKTYSNANAKFTTYFDTYKVNVYGRVDPVVVFKKAIDMTIEARGLRPGDKIRLIVSPRSWTKPFSTKLVTITADEHFFYNFEFIKAVIEFVEYKSVPLNDVTIEVQSTKIPRGAGRLKITKHNIGCKKSVICIKNADTTCLARAIVTAVANNNKAIWTKSQIKNGFNDSRKLQETEALKLHDAAGVSITDFGNTLEDVDTFAKHLGIQINIVDADYFNEIVYSTDTNCSEMIYLNKNINHFDVITSMPGFLGTCYYCHSCKKGYAHRDKHRCPNKCLACFKTKQHIDNAITCDKCNRTFFGKDCYDENLRNRSKGEKRDVVCELVQKCQQCRRTVTDLTRNVCGYAICNNCKSYCDPQTHKCYMLPVETKGGACTRDKLCDGPKKDCCLCCKTRTIKYMFYDLETQQQTGTHVVNYVHALGFDEAEYTFSTIEPFCEFVFNGEHQGYTFIAHNAKSFDAQFILKYCIDNAIKPFCIYNGTKIMYMQIEAKIED